MIQVMAWCITVGKPLPEPVLIKMSGAMYGSSEHNAMYKRDIREALAIKYCLQYKCLSNGPPYFINIVYPTCLAMVN